MLKQAFWNSGQCSKLHANVLTAFGKWVLIKTMLKQAFWNSGQCSKLHANVLTAFGLGECQLKPSLWNTGHRLRLKWATI